MQVTPRRTMKILTLQLFLMASIFSTNVSASKNHPYDRFDFNLNPGIDVYVAPKLLRFFEGNLDSLFDRHGYSPSSYYLHEIGQRTGVTPLEEIVTNPSILSSIKSLRYQFRKFFSGIRISNDHDLEVKATGLDLTANWKKFGVRIIGHEDPNTVTAVFILEANRINLDVSSLRVEDHQHPFIGEIGGDKFFLKLDENNGPPLELLIPVVIKKSPLGNQIEFNVRPIESNVSSLNLLAGWSAPLLLPRIKVTVNNRSSYMRASAVERTLKREIPNLIKGIQESLDAYLLNEAPEKIQETLERSLGEGYQDFINIPILFNPNMEEESYSSQGQIEHYPDSAILGMKLNQFEVVDGHFRFQMNAFLEDGQKERGNFISPYKKAKNKISTRYLNQNNHDVAAAVDIGLINNYLKISCDRGYLKNINLGDETIEIAGCPYAKINKNEKQIRLVVNVVEDPDYGWYQISGYAINSPIVVRFELGLELVVSHKGKVGLKFNRIFPETAFVAPQYINFASESVHEAAREKLVEVNNESAGMIIEEEIPLPENLNGISLKYLDAAYDHSGNIIFYIKTVL